MAQNKPPNRFRLFAWYAGPDYYNAYGLRIAVAFGLRGDLMTKGDEGRIIPCALAFELTTGQSFEAMEDRRLDGWVFRPRFRCEAGEIARRLAGGDE